MAGGFALIVEFDVAVSSAVLSEIGIVAVDNGGVGIRHLSIERGIGDGEVFRSIYGQGPTVNGDVHLIDGAGATDELDRGYGLEVRNVDDAVGKCDGVGGRCVLDVDLCVCEG